MRQEVKILIAFVIWVLLVVYFVTPVMVGGILSVGSGGDSIPVSGDIITPDPVSVITHTGDFRQSRVNLNVVSIPIGERRAVGWQFPFQGRYHAISTDVSMAAYRAAQMPGAKGAPVVDFLSEEEWDRQYYLAFVVDGSQRDVYRKLNEQFRALRDAHRLTDDEYVEMVIAWVRNIPDDPSSERRLAKLPVETVVDNEGADFDRALLFAGVLADAGYDSALLMVKGSDGILAGVKTPAGSMYGFRNTGYYFIDLAPPGYTARVPAGEAVAIPILRNGGMTYNP